jgi:hypothetical protein
MPSHELAKSRGSLDLDSIDNRHARHHIDYARTLREALSRQTK